MRKGWEKRQFLALRFCCGRWKDFAFRNLAGALYSYGGGCTLSVGQEVKMEIPIETLFDLVLFPIQDLLKQKHGESWPKRDRETLEIRNLIIKRG